MEPLLLPVLLAGLVTAVAWAVLRGRGQDPLGPRPEGELPDTRVACAVGVLAYLAGQFVAQTTLKGTDAGRFGGFTASVLAGSVVNALVAIAILPAALRGSRRAVLGARGLVLAGVLAGFMVFALQAVVGFAIHDAYTRAGLPLPVQDVVSQAKTAHGPDLVVFTVGAVLLAPFAEEIFFRGILLPAAARVTTERQALVLQALVFGGIHVVGAWQTWPLAIPLALVGWCAGWLYLRTGSLAAPILLHATFNAINFALLRASS
jgi:membrane protease YdiL (CAAX protease family)